MEKTLTVHNLEATQTLIDTDILDVDEAYPIGEVTFEDGTVMEVFLYGTEDGTFLQGVILGLGNDETDDVTDTLDVEGYRVKLV